MSAKQFEHFMNLQQQLATMRRGARRSVKAASRIQHGSASAVSAAKDWLAANGRGR